MWINVIIQVMVSRIPMWINVIIQVMVSRIPMWIGHCHRCIEGHNLFYLLIENVSTFNIYFFKDSSVICKRTYKSTLEPLVKLDKSFRSYIYIVNFTIKIYIYIVNFTIKTYIYIVNFTIKIYIYIVNFTIKKYIYIDNFTTQIYLHS